MSYGQNDNFVGNRPVHGIQSTGHDVLPVSPVTSIAPIHPGQIVKVLETHRPIWVPEMQKLESQYLETYRTIKSSVLTFYYKMQYIVNYFMSLFTFAGKF